MLWNKDEYLFHDSCSEDRAKIQESAGNRPYQSVQQNKELYNFSMCIIYRMYSILQKKNLNPRILILAWKTKPIFFLNKDFGSKFSIWDWIINISLSKKWKELNSFTPVFQTKILSFRTIQNYKLSLVKKYIFYTFFCYLFWIKFFFYFLSKFDCHWHFSRVVCGLSNLQKRKSQNSTAKSKIILNETTNCYWFEKTESMRTASQDTDMS